MQIPGVDYSESFAPVASDTSIRVIIEMFLYYHHIYKKSNCYSDMFDVEAAFLNADLDNQVFIEWPQGMFNLGFITEEDKLNKCIELTNAMYGNIDSPLRWMKTFSKHLMEQLKLQQSMTDPCIVYTVKHNKVVLILAMYVDDTLCLGHKEELECMYNEIQKKFKIEKLGRLNKHLRIWYESKNDKVTQELNLEASIPKLTEEVIISYNKSIGKKEKLSSVPATEHWIELGKCVGYLRYGKNLKLIYRNPDGLRSISTWDSKYAQDPND
jgi:Reverse transcriptase (RNA-dependent DNA polymerase)